MPKDHDLIKQFNDGDRKAFDKLVTKHINMTYNYYYSITRDELEADDLTQRVFIKLYKSLKNFRFDAAFTTYLYRIKVNTLNSYFFKNKWRSFLHLDQVPELHVSDDNYEKKALSIELWNAIKTLPKKQRNVMNLRVSEGLSFREVGDVLNISEDAAKNNYSHGLKTLRKIMDTNR
jgi:RNA polymerase sigma-70 factor (ECF subfamily)|tara:strand:- start:749 stop:1276 length:528 start_codon:yes stop_codon:yes gene_type:complete